MRKGFNLMMILGAVMIFASCNKMQSYVDMLKAEEKAIDRLIDKNGFEILSEYPADGVFKENQFYLMENGVYINVIDSGNGQKYKNGDIVQSRFNFQFFKTDLEADTMENLTGDIYGGPAAFKAYFSDFYNTQVEIASGNSAPGDFIGEGLASVLEFVGDSSYVKLIVPFKRMSGDLNKNGEPVFFPKVRYIYQK